MDNVVEVGLAEGAHSLHFGPLQYALEAELSRCKHFGEYDKKKLTDNINLSMYKYIFISFSFTDGIKIGP